MKKITSLFAVAVVGLGIQQAAHGAILLNSVDWTEPGIPASGVFGTNNISFTTASYNNAGQFFTFNWGGMPFAANYSTTNNDAVAIGYTAGTSTTTVTFSESISNLSLWFNYIDSATTFDFTGLSWTFVAGNNASRSGDTVISTGGNTADDGFLINIAGAFGPSSPLAFSITRAMNDTAGFTISAPAPTNPVPEPGQVATSLLLLGGIGGYVFLKRRKSAKTAVAIG
jgi:hypothetical protein